MRKSLKGNARRVQKLRPTKEDLEIRSCNSHRKSCEDVMWYRCMFTKWGIKYLPHQAWLFLLKAFEYRHCVGQNFQVKTSHYCQTRRTLSRNCSFSQDWRLSHYLAVNLQFKTFFKLIELHSTPIQSVLFLLKMLFRPIFVSWAFRS